MSSSSYALAFRWRLSSFISLNAGIFPSSLNALIESHPMKACSLNRPSQILSPNDILCLLMSMCLVRAWLPHLHRCFQYLWSRQCHQTTIAILHAKYSGIHCILWCGQFRNGWYSFFVNLERIFLAYLIHYHLVSSNRSFIHASQKNVTTGGFPPKHPMIDLHGNIFCPNIMLLRNLPCTHRILYWSYHCLCPSFKPDAKIISVT